MSLKNYLPMFVLTFKLKGGLNQISFLFRFRRVFWNGFSNFSVPWYPLFLSAALYVILHLLKPVSSRRISLKCVYWSLMSIAWWLTVGGWNLNVYVKVYYSFFSVFKLKETSKKSVSMRFVSILIDSPWSLNKLVIS